MPQVFLSLGSNQGNRQEQLNRSVGQIQNYGGKLINISDIFESKSWGYKDSDYLNTVIEIETKLSPHNLLRKTQEIEKKSGRKSKTRIINGKPVYSARTVDIDILFYENKIIELEHLKVPHPLLHFRRFVLQPMQQIAANFVHPVFNETIEQLYLKCDDKSSLTVFQKVQREDFLLL
jgi:deoxyguanosine kinase